MAVPPDCVSLPDYARHFARRADPAVRAYVDGAAADGITQARNRAVLDALCLLPRVLRDLRGASAAIDLFGQRLAHPIIAAPTAYHRLVHPEGELASARACGLTETPFVASTLASTPIEAIAAATTGPLWFQLYAQPRWDDTLALARRAEAAGCTALMLTADAPVSGIRNMEQRAGFRLPEGVRAVNLPPAPASAPPAAGSPVFQGMLDAAPTWETVERLCRETPVPVVLKGVLAPDDAARAIDAGCRGIVVSNHGGRVLDTVPAAIEMLPEVAARVAGRVPLLVDGGIRRGTDIVKALALGATAVMIGRPVLHALAVGGLPGVAHMLTVLKTELEATMALTGCPRVADIDAGLIRGGR
ncbi:alpha-hydroxy acid oxidase [Xanthobacter sp. V2C-8]|uniref:alpha-hydroxy acid oxidase n=1 Tax=Xanthobacter albus TaxID=3119929 RepID=UPI00372B1AE3